ncbi:hypothetical protein [Azospirillum picis]|uniref:RNA methylase n=1 Tax=Azospirillum picis TaxID=488438 RepID=A0ABU0MV59_9PROT|nr:hypothetical protein [Azospirillum picis]MBP2303435.1 putative RNA methylase [Azospirillum picis]MDQ0537306.1 putative RNA methylase [Azospirillum picis]
MSGPLGTSSALRAGWDEVIGIEMDPEYVATARARCAVAGVQVERSGLMAAE